MTSKIYLVPSLIFGFFSNKGLFGKWDSDLRNFKLFGHILAINYSYIFIYIKYKTY